MSEPHEDEVTFVGGRIRERTGVPVRTWMWAVWIAVLLAGLVYLALCFRGRTLDPETNEIIREYNEAVKPGRQ